ncbi:hypothetical protein MUCCIDRAFT_167622 [Mucor lusitanicus CBS 277.49]|uniref:DDE Tnp4 domain-containing protein n=1 Tax=Mucor lusitanicus CBS 277.49 TaxID=747725 RepID=A0A168HA14_MUCCL|nr:hypothetical protein MUCCIDRAFT_167622 [Mucor lusitanicus CBS 277.49]
MRKIKQANAVLKIAHRINSLKDVKKVLKVPTFNIPVIAESLEKVIKEHPDSKKLEAIQSRRYLRPRKDKPYRKRSDQEDDNTIDKFFNKYTEVQFRMFARMSKPCFFRLYDEINDHQVFINNSGPPQRNVRIQMLVALTRLGMSGNGDTNRRLALTFDISHGSVNTYCNRFREAVKSLEPEYARWPNEEEKRKILHKHKERYDLHDCIGFMDGSIIPLYRTPHFHPDKFFSRKQVPAMQSVFICDADLRVLYHESGHYGSSNDPGVIMNGLLLPKVPQFFPNNEYVIADSIYRKTTWCMPIKKESDGLTGSDKKFNNYLSKARVRVEHCFAALKGRFPSLEGLRYKLNKREDLGVHTDVLKCCTTLHNFCLQHDVPAFIGEYIDQFCKKHEADGTFHEAVRSYYADADIDANAEYENSPLLDFYGATNGVP